jgi:hypothetical protein
MGQVFIFIILGQIREARPKSVCAYQRHVLPQASMLQEADALFKTILTPETLQSIVNLIPLEWLDWQDTDESPDAIREVYLQFYRCACIILKFSLKKPKCKRNTYMSTVIRVVPRVEREEFLNGIIFLQKRSL